MKTSLQLQSVVHVSSFVVVPSLLLAIPWTLTHPAARHAYIKSLLLSSLLSFITLCICFFPKNPSLDPMCVSLLLCPKPQWLSTCLSTNLSLLPKPLVKCGDVRAFVFVPFDQNTFPRYNVCGPVLLFQQNPSRCGSYVLLCSFDTFLELNSEIYLICLWTLPILF
jgi:hypothetical protein